MLFTDLVSSLDTLLNIRSCDAIDGALNGLQVSRDNTPIERCAVAVDACMDSFQRAVDGGAQLLVVHHGMYWGKQQALVGAHCDRVRFLLDCGLGLYAAHLPLDIHATLGNNIAICDALGLRDVVPFGSYKGVAMGYGGTLDTPLTVQQISTLFMERQMQCGCGMQSDGQRGCASGMGESEHGQLMGAQQMETQTHNAEQDNTGGQHTGERPSDVASSGAVAVTPNDDVLISKMGEQPSAGIATTCGIGGGPIEPLGILPFGMELCARVAVVSGGGGFALDEAIADNYDLLITGDMSYPAYYTSYEAGINVLFAGHYATETWGVKRVAAWLNSNGVATTFIDLPTGL